MSIKIFEKFCDSNYLNDEEKERIKLVQEKINSDSERLANSIALDLTVILESKMIRILESYGIFTPVKERTASSLFDQIKKLYRSEKQAESDLYYNEDVNVPKIISNTFYYLINLRNTDECHAKEINIKRTFTDTIHLLKNFDAILSFLINYFDDLDFKVVPFDETSLLKLLNKKIHFIDQITNKDSVSDTTTIKLGKISISSLILDPKYSFFIPSYQRKYTWSQENCVDLVDNIISKLHSQEDEYFGTIAVNNDDTEENSSKTLIRLIDGQQRVTTSLLIFRAIYDIVNYRKEDFFEENTFEMPIELEKTFSGEGCSNKYTNVTGNKSDNKVLDFILNSNISYKERNLQIVSFKKDEKTAALNYDIIHNRLMSLDQKELELFYNRYAYKFLVSCVDFNKSPSEEMEIFEKLNSMGTELEAFDMIKNFLFNLVRKDIYIKEESKITELFNEYISFDSLKLSKKNTEKLQETFLYSFCEYKLLFLKQSDNTLRKKDKKSILKHFKKIYFDKVDISLDEYQKIVSEIGKYVAITKSFTQKKYEIDSNDILYPIRYVLSNIAHKSITIYVLFFFIDIYGKNNWDSYSKSIDFSSKIDLMKRTLFQFERWFITLVQAEGAGDSLPKIILKLIRFLLTFDIYNYEVQMQIPEMISAWLTMSTNENMPFLNNTQKRLLLENDSLKIPSKTNFYNSIVTQKMTDGIVRMVMLKRLESFLLNGAELKRDKNSLEHIMPQKIENTSWIKELMAEEPELNQKEILEKHELFLNKIGNYTILDKNSENSKLSNSSFINKKEYYKKWNNILASFKYDKSKNISIFETDKFGFEEIQKRTDAFADILVNEIYYK
ncbi:hypothetical protein CG001_01605 [Mesoplasma coleopterae]|uniref:DUF262 domain-containing protein n=1 Tax=Mesoplasma coleopterae TaxID=324078 RepID=UPI000D043E64|nr:DUF262 domain-containing protein [Mesoplasma coleopterae]AVN62338.1 hypothetical protein CG001_01605 [Mesoplasma coleopterae]